MMKTYLFGLFIVVVIVSEVSVCKYREPLLISGTMTGTKARIALKADETIMGTEGVDAYEGIIESYENSGFSVNYGFAYITDDDFPELIVDLKDYWVSMYTFADGEARAVMEYEAYGTWGRRYTYFEKTGIVNASGYEFIDETDGECRQENFWEIYKINEKYELEQINIKRMRGSNITKKVVVSLYTSPIDFRLSRR